MISPESIKYSLKNISNRKMRSFLTILSIFVGITTIFIFISFGWGLYDYIEEMTQTSSADKILIQPKGIGAPGLDDSFKLTDEDVEVIKGTAGVFDATGVYFKTAKVEQDNKIIYTFLIGYDPKNPMIMEFFNIDIEEGRELRGGDSGKIVLGYGYLEKDRVLPNPYRLNNKITVQDQELRIVGFFEEVGSPQDDAQVYVTREDIELIYPEENNSYGWIIAKVDIKNIDEITKRVQENLRKSRGLEKGQEDFFVQSFNDMIESYSSALNIVIGFVILIALISVLVSAVNTSNTMITSVLERVKEIGVLKAIGARNSEIFKIFLFESSLLGFVAGIIGVLLGYGLTELGASILDNLGWGFLSPHYSWVLFGGCIAFATLTGAISGVIPAINASKTNIVKALRYE